MPLQVRVSRQLSEMECKALQKKLREKAEQAKVLLRVRSAFLVKATVREQVGSHQMDQGPFLRKVPIYVDEIHVDHATPVVAGVVKGIVEVGAYDDQGKVQLKSFPARDGATMVIPLFADPKLALEQVSHSPEGMKVELHKRPKQAGAQRAQWDLKVTVPPGTNVNPSDGGWQNPALEPAALRR